VIEVTQLTTRQLRQVAMARCANAAGTETACLLGADAHFTSGDHGGIALFVAAHLNPFLVGASFHFCPRNRARIAHTPGSL
jgi:hypothetical protein